MLTFHCCSVSQIVTRVRCLRRQHHIFVIFRRDKCSRLVTVVLRRRRSNYWYPCPRRNQNTYSLERSVERCVSQENGRPSRTAKSTVNIQQRLKHVCLVPTLVLGGNQHLFLGGNSCTGTNTCFGREHFSLIFFFERREARGWVKRQACGGAVSEAAAKTELVIVEQ